MTLLSTTEAADLAGTSVENLRSLARRELIGQRVGNRWAFSAAEIEQQKAAGLFKGAGRPALNQEDES